MSYCDSPSDGRVTSWNDSSTRNLRNISRACAGRSIGSKWPVEVRGQVRGRKVTGVKKWPVEVGGQVRGREVTGVVIERSSNRIGCHRELTRKSKK